MASTARIQITPIGNLGNQMLQVMLLEALRRRTPSVEFGGIALPDWNLRRDLAVPIRERALRVIGQYVDVDGLRRLIEGGVVSELEFAALGFRMENYLPRSGYDALFAPRDVGGPVPLGDCLTINVRGAEILANTHADYGPIPIAFYEQLVAATGLRPVFMGQLGADDYTRALRSKFANATFIESRGIVGDFELMRSARHLVLSVSTFSWLAGWLSNAETIHFPMLGMFNPQQREDIDLLPVDDPRYVFYAFPVRQWNGSAEQFRALYQTARFTSLPKGEVVATLKSAKGLLAARARRYRVRLAWAARIYRYTGIGIRVGLDRVSLN